MFLARETHAFTLGAVAKRTQIRRVIEDRCHGVVDFYVGADLTAALLAQINRELSDVLIRATQEYGIAPLPYVLRARVGANGYLVVYPVSWDVS